jgi:aldose sugar dehydrogenase
LSTPVGKLLRVKKDDGSAAPGNPFVDRPGVDPRIFAYGFRENFDFAFHPATGKLYGTDNTTVSCEELNVIESGANYGWPNVRTFPFSDCKAGGQKTGIYFFSKVDTRPEDFLSNVIVSGVAFASGAVYPTLGDSLMVCESGTGLLRRLVLTGPDLQQVSASDIAAKDCKLDVAVSPDGIIYYSNIKRFAVSPRPPPRRLSNNAQ